ncbi:hypothetical protein Q3G72_019214 [Acer saccharum]|nr:hypothetical protein Q3G72_019214 [Acer saccharum]
MLSLAKKLSNAKSLTLTVRFSGAMSGWMLCNNAFDEETRLEEKVEDEPENPWLTIRKLEFYPIARFRQSEVEAALDYVTSFRIEEIEFFGMVGIKNIPIEEDESDEEDEEDESDEEPMLFHNDFSVFLPNLLKSKTLKTLKLRFENCSMLEEMKIHYTLPVLIAWRETVYQNKEYFFDMIFTDNGGGLNGKDATSLLKFSMDGKETERLWCFDGAKVLQSNPSCWGQLHNNI